MGGVRISRGCVVLLLVVDILLLPCSHCLLRLPLQQAVGVVNGLSDDGKIEREKRGLDGVMQPMQGISGEGYYINISVGTPPQQMQILIDTGSSNFAIAASPDPNASHYFNSSLSSTYSASLLGTTVYVPYTQGEWEGLLGTDVVALSSLPNLTFHPNVAFIFRSTSFFIPEANWQGIVGLAYQSIARPDSLQPFWDSLRDAAGLDDIFSMQLCGSAFSHDAASAAAMEGSLILGGIADDLYTGEIFYSPIVKDMYYEVVISDIAVNNMSLNMDCKEYNFDKTIVDSGTTHLRLPQRVFDQVVGVIKKTLVKRSGTWLGQEEPALNFWTGESLLCWNDLPLAFDVFPPISVSLVSTQGHSQFFTLHLTSQHYLRSVSSTVVRYGYLNQLQTCLKFGISPSDSGTVLGALLMEAYYVVFDRRNKQMGFAVTTCPPPYPGQPSPPIVGIFTDTDRNLTSCHYQRAVTSDSSLIIITYVMAGVCAVCALPLLIVLIQWQLRKCLARRRGQLDPEAETVLTDSR